MREPAAHFDMVRTGIAIYGLSPFGDDPDAPRLRPALRLSSYVAGIREVEPGESVGYGRRFIADRPARLAIVPIGYADGIARALTNRGDVLIAGRRCRITGTISMDQLTVLLPDDPQAVRPGDEVVFIGRSGAERILAEDVARLLDTINYEIACDVSPRVVRRYAARPRLPSGWGARPMLPIPPPRLTRRRRPAPAAAAARRERRPGSWAAPCATPAAPALRRHRPGRGRRRRGFRPLPGGALDGAAFSFSDGSRPGASSVRVATSTWRRCAARRSTTTCAAATSRSTPSLARWARSSATLVDPCGGLADLRARRLAACAPGALDDDPVRVVRLARLRYELDLTLAAGLEQAAGAAAGALPR